jgi:SSS family solute:Na+ symporter
MGLDRIDYAIIAVYLIGVAWIGTRIGGRQRSSQDYFLGGKALPWWAVGLSVVASETSTLTFISVPGLA